MDRGEPSAKGRREGRGVDVKTFKPPVPPPFVCADGRTIGIAPWSYSMEGGPFRSAVEMRDANGGLLDSVAINFTREDCRRFKSADDAIAHVMQQFEQAIFELAFRFLERGK